jgi:hypothetical protein
MRFLNGPGTNENGGTMAGQSGKIQWRVHGRSAHGVHLIVLPARPQCEGRVA